MQHFCRQVQKNSCRIVVLWGLFGSAAWASESLHGRALADLSLEQLGNIMVTSVSRQEERLSSAAASIFVITANDIRRAGVRSLPEALRLAPNLQVARSDARNYAVTARGFNSTLENKLLVLIDGRSIYSPLFSGVFWDAQDVVMEDIDRIEVISGPGSTIWGANAVNGVINIITRSARDTQGGLLAAGASGQEKNAVVRYGGELANGGYYRVYGKYADDKDTYTRSGANTQTGLRRRQAGFRTDWNDASRNVTVQGDAYTGNLGQSGTSDIWIAGANLIGRIDRKSADGSSMRVQAYWDHTERNQPGAFVEHLDTLDLEFQRALSPSGAHRVTWGGGYRHTWDRVQNGTGFAFLPASLNMHWGNVFVQDEIELHRGVRLTAGVKLEHNNYTGLEYLPTLRLAWTPDERQLVWGALSRTVRAPSRIDRDFFVPANPVLVSGVSRYLLSGNPDYVSETANVLEIGYRAQPTAALSYSLTAFYSKYDKLRTVEILPGASAVLGNMGEGTVSGIEAWGSWHAAPGWRLSAGWVEQRIRTQLKPGSLDPSGVGGQATSDPDRYLNLRSSHDISDKMQLDVMLRYMGRLPQPLVRAYYQMDMRLAWKPRRDLELALVGNNLLHASHVEFGAAPGRSVIERSLLLQITYAF